MAGSCNFNPRSREGSDKQLGYVTTKGMVISIHAPVKGATNARVKETVDGVISIHAPVKGATRSWTPSIMYT